MNHERRLGRMLGCAVARVLLGTALLPAATVAAAEAWKPLRPVRVVVMSTPSSGPDILARMMGPRFADTFGQQLVVDDRAGAAGIIGAEIGARAAPDGHTLILATMQIVIVSVLYDKLPFDLRRDFAPVSLLASTPFIMVIHPGVPASDLREFIALAKAHPGELRYGSGGSGSPVHLAAERFKSMTGTSIRHVPYKGVAPALTDVIGAQIQMTFSVVPMIMPHIKAGRVRALGISSVTRSPLAPDLPAIAEVVPGYEIMGWYGVLVPAHTPPAIIDRYNREFVKFVKSADVMEKLTALGAEAKGTTAEAFAGYLHSETEKLRALVKASGAKIE